MLTDVFLVRHLALPDIDVDVDDWKQGRPYGGQHLRSEPGQRCRVDFHQQVLDLQNTKKKENDFGDNITVGQNGDWGRAIVSRVAELQPPFFRFHRVLSARATSGQRRILKNDVEKIRVQNYDD